MFEIALKDTVFNERLNISKFLNKITCGDNLELLTQIPDESVDLIVTSPPYFNQRNYGAGFGNEETCQEYIENLLRTFQECVRVIKPTGSIIYNLGDKLRERQFTACAVSFCDSGDGKVQRQTCQRDHLGQDESDSAPTQTSSGQQHRAVFSFCKIGELPLFC